MRSHQQTMIHIAKADLVKLAGLMAGMLMGFNQTIQRFADPDGICCKRMALHVLQNTFRFL